MEVSPTVSEEASTAESTTEEPEENSFPWIWVVLGVVLLGGGGALLLMRKKK